MKRRSSTRPPPEITFFADRNLGKAFAAILRKAGLKVEAHDDHFGPKTEDVEWIDKVTRQNWVILTFDKHIGFNDREIDALMAAGGRAYLPKGRMHPEEFAGLIVRSRARVERHILKQRKHRTGPYMAKISRGKTAEHPGEVERWIDTAVWQEKILKRSGGR